MSVIGSARRKSHTRFDSSNPLARIQNNLIRALANRSEIPKYIVVVLEDDVIKFLNYNDYGVSELYGKTIDYLFRELKNITTSFKNKLPQKARRITWPFFIWLTPTTHANYSNNALRKKFGHEMDALINGTINKRQFGHSGAAALKLMQLWCCDDVTLTVDGVISERGTEKLWQAVDRTIRYTDWKLEDKSYFSKTSRSQSRPFAARPQARPDRTSCLEHSSNSQDSYFS